MQTRVFRIAIVGQLLLFAPEATAQDYRGRVQGSVLDSTQGTLPGTSVTLVNDATGVAVTFVADKDGHYIFDFVEPGVYTITGELQGFKKAQQRNVRVAQRGSVTADLRLEIGGLEERVVVEAPPVTVQFKSSSSVIWDNPDVNVSNANFGKVTRKRVDGTGREVQVGLRFVF